MGNKEFNKDVRELIIRTKVSTLLKDRPVVLLKQESTVELALQASQTPASNVSLKRAKNQSSQDINSSNF